LNPFLTSEALVFLLLAAILFLFFFRSVFELKRSGDSESGEIVDTRVCMQSHEKRPKAGADPFLGLENIEEEENEEQRFKRATPDSGNPILVLTNIEN